MHEPTRTRGPLAIDARCHALLAELRLIEGARAPALLDIDAIDGLERIFEVRLADDVLAVLAADSPQLYDSWRLRLDAIPESCEHAWRLIFGEDALTAHDPDWLYAEGPFCLGVRWDGTLMLYPRDASREGPTVVTLWRDGVCTERPLPDVLRDEVDQARLVADVKRQAEQSAGAPPPSNVVPLASRRFSPRLVERG